MDKLSVGKRVKVQNMPHHRLVAYLTKMRPGEEEWDSMSMNQLREASAEIIVSGRETPPEISEEGNTGSVESSISVVVQLQLIELKRLKYERLRLLDVQRRREEREEAERLRLLDEQRRREEKEEAERLRLLAEKRRREEKEEAEKLRLLEEKRRREEKEEAEDRKSVVEGKSVDIGVRRGSTKKAEKEEN